MSKSTISDAPELAPPRKVIHAYSDEYPTPLSAPKTYYDSGYTPTGPLYSTAPEYVETPQPERKKTILGLRRRSFWILVAMMIFLLAATVGASVGGTIAVQNRNKPATNTPAPATRTTTSPASTTSSSPTPTSSSANGRYTPMPPEKVVLANNSCPPDNSDVKTSNAESYRCMSGKNVGGNDLAAIVAYTLQQCVDACSEMNSLANARNACKGVVMAEDLSNRYLKGNRANCWLKSKVSGEVDSRECVMAVKN